MPDKHDVRVNFLQPRNDILVGEVAGIGIEQFNREPCVNQGACDGEQTKRRLVTVAYFVHQEVNRWHNTDDFHGCSFKRDSL